MAGSMRLVGPDTWELRVYAGLDDTGRQRQVSRRFHGKSRAAAKALAALVVEVGAGRQQRPVAAKGTVAALLEAHLGALRQAIADKGRSPTTLRTYRSMVNGAIIPALGAIPARKVSGADLDRFYAELRSPEPPKWAKSDSRVWGAKSAATVRQYHALLSGAFRRAIRWGWVDTNPCVCADPPSRVRPDISPPTVGEIRQLIEAAEAKDLDLAVFLFLATTTGIRRGELCALRWADISLGVPPTVTVTHAVVDLYGPGPKQAVKDTKGHSGRQMAIDPASREVLAAHLERMVARAGHPLTPALAYVFSQDVASRVPYRPDRITGAFRRLRRRVGLEHVNLHHLRHFSATTLIAAGLDVRTVAGRHGHANPAVTLNTYSHFVEAADARAAVVMGDLGLPVPGAR